MLKSNSFSKDYRLKTKAEFTETFNHNTKQVSKSLVTYYKPETSLKVGFIVSKKISKKAVIRNKIKRILREIFRTNKPESGHFIFIARLSILKTSFEELTKEYNYITKKIVNRNVKKPYHQTN